MVRQYYVVWFMVLILVQSWMDHKEKRFHHFWPIWHKVTFTRENKLKYFSFILTRKSLKLRLHLFLFKFCTVEKVQMQHKQVSVLHKLVVWLGVLVTSTNVLITLANNKHTPFTFWWNPLDFKTVLKQILIVVWHQRY